MKPNEILFSRIVQQNLWRGKESASGPGSDRVQTAALVTELPKVLDALQIDSILDLPCGDFNWMRLVPLDGRKYIGGDLVRALVLQNNQRFSASNIDFVQLDITSDRLPDADLLLCRDCLVHFSYRDIFRSLENMCRSKINYVMMTSFPARMSNADITTGLWRPLNLTLSPFFLPAPRLWIDERCSENNGEFRDKTLNLWAIDDVRRVLRAPGSVAKLES